MRAIRITAGRKEGKREREGEGGRETDRGRQTERQRQERGECPPACASACVCGIG